MTISPGAYEGQAIKGKAQLGETENNTLQIAIDMELFNEKNESVGVMTTFLYFTSASALYSYERLRALGWKGTGPDDIDKLDDIYDKRVPCRITAPVPYMDPTTKTMKTGSAKLEIAGGGTVVISKPLDAGSFKARLRAIGGGSGSSTGSSSGGSKGNEPPF